MSDINWRIEHCGPFATNSKVREVRLYLFILCRGGLKVFSKTHSTILSKTLNFSSAYTHQKRHITYLRLSERSSSHLCNEKVGSLIHARSHRNTLNEKRLNQEWSLRRQNIHYHFFDGITPGIYATKTTRTSESIFPGGGVICKGYVTQW